MDDLGLRHGAQTGGIDHQGFDASTGLFAQLPWPAEQTVSVGQRGPTRATSMRQGGQLQTLTGLYQSLRGFGIRTSCHQNIAHHHRLPRLVSLQGHGLGQPQQTAEAMTEVGIDEIQIGIGHVSGGELAKPILAQSAHPSALQPLESQGHLGRCHAQPPALRAMRQVARCLRASWIQVWMHQNVSPI